MPKPSPIDDLATSMAAELERDTAKLAGMLKPEIQQVGTEKMTKAEYLGYVHRNWADPTFRTGLLQQIGNKAFLDLTQDVVAAHGHPPLPGLTLQPPMIQSGMAPAPPPQLQPGGPRVG